MDQTIPTPPAKWAGLVSSFMIQNLVPLFDKNGNKSKYSLEEGVKAVRDVCGLLYEDLITAAKGREVFKTWWETGETVEQQHLRDPITKCDIHETYLLCLDVAYLNRKILEDCQKGNRKKLGSIVGQIMRSSKNRCDPEQINAFLDFFISWCGVIDWSNPEQTDMFWSGYFAKNTEEAQVSNEEYHGDMYFDESPLGPFEGQSNQASAPPSLNKKNKDSFKPDEDRKDQELSEKVSRRLLPNLED